MVNLILFGPPGSGKGTQSANIIQKYGLIHLSTGDLLRSEIGNKTPLGLEAKKFMDQGLLVPDEVVIGMISSKLEANPEARGFIFDGFPRTTAQAEALDKLLTLKKTAISVVLSLEVPEDELIKRLLNRGLTSGRSDDASEEVVKARIVEYHNKTAPVADHYAKFGKFKKVKGDGTEEEVFELLSKELDELVGERV
ncbi:adenylate kinase [Chitinophaga polysaccharea]|uniref:Adenylate kinase n=1 Tax=Chitinophaga polysaccharea TaxID=1293035 RepID=A0A561Q2K5_9BACT|nr:adenylate kinase [Chitinophaga polysaccharea]NLR59921.1 adenylate kinase [Chitinophaga polysaccharea]TWF44598.1 adenylate kinase [Chitinophaga polysaccharea]